MILASYCLQNWRLRNFIPLDDFVEGLAEEPYRYCLLLIIWPFLYVSCLVQDSAILEPKFCPVCKLCCLTIHFAFHSPGPQIVEPLIHFFWTKHVHGWLESTFMTWIAVFCLIYLAFFEQKMSKIWRCVPIKK